MAGVDVDLESRDTTWAEERGLAVARSRSARERWNAAANAAGEGEVEHIGERGRARCLDIGGGEQRERGGNYQRGGGEGIRLGRESRVWSSFYIVWKKMVG